MSRTRPVYSREHENARKLARVWRKRMWVRQYKLDKGCVDCGYNFHHAALALDHRPGSGKIAPVNKMLVKSWKALFAEVAKCDVRCHNCHSIRHSEENAQ